MVKLKPIMIILAVLLALGLLVAVVSAQTAAPTATSDAAAPDHLSQLITTAKASGKAITFDFIVPLVTGELVWTLPDDTAKRSISAVGADYICFSEPWNAGSRERCTALSNISSITFLK